MHLPPSGGGRKGLEQYAIAETFESLLETTRDVLPLALVEIGFAEILERMLVDQEVVHDAQNAVSYGNHRLLESAASQVAEIGE